MKGKDLILKILVEISRFLLGATFIFSGFVKAVDPMGFAYKIQDYLLAFGLESLTFLSLAISIAVCVGEFALGAFMFVGLYRRVTSILMLLVMLFMTALTFYLAIANPVSDCGCFGDFLVITNWQTFSKNIILLLCAVIAFFNFHRITNFFTGKFYWVVGIFTIFYIFGFSFYNSYYEPVFDFRPYKVGANLPNLMSVKDGDGDVYENVFIYEKDGLKKDFTEQNYPWQDTTWHFVEMSTKLIKAGKKPLITDFKVEKLNFNQNKTEIESQEDITQEILADSGYVFLMVSYSLFDAKIDYLPAFEDVNNYANDRHYKFFCLTASTSDDIIRFENSNTFNFVYCKTDERVLKTIVRSNPGLVLLKNGVIVNKWAGAKVLKEESLVKPIEELDVNKVTSVDADASRHLCILILLYVVPLVAIKLFDFLIYQKNKNYIE